MNPHPQDQPVDQVHEVGARARTFRGRGRGRVVPPVGRQRLDTVYVERPRCPACGSTRFRRYRSQHDQGDGSSFSYAQCGNRSCGHRFRIIQE